MSNNAKSNVVDLGRKRKSKKLVKDLNAIGEKVGRAPKGKNGGTSISSMMEIGRMLEQMLEPFVIKEDEKAGEDTDAS